MEDVFERLKEMTSVTKKDLLDYLNDTDVPDKYKTSEVLEMAVADMVRYYEDNPLDDDCKALNWVEVFQNVFQDVISALFIVIVKTLDNNTPNSLFTNEPSSVGSCDDWDDEDHPENYAEWIIPLNEVEECEEEFKTTVYELLKYNYQYRKDNYTTDFQNKPDAEKDKIFHEETDELYTYCKEDATLNDAVPCTFGEIRIDAFG